MGKTKQRTVRGRNTILPNDIKIKDVLLSITNFCLGSCVYCNLKSLSSFDYDSEYAIKDIRRLFEDPALNDIDNVHITGGEPILSPKTYEVFKVLHETHPDIRLNMPVSGFFPYATYRYCLKLLELMPQLRVDISVDGTPLIHEMLRGSWEPVEKTIRLLSTIPELEVQLQLTLTKTNYTHINYVEKMAEELGFGFYITFPHFGIRFGHIVNNPHHHSQSFIDSVDKQLKDWCKIRPLNKQIWDIQKAEWEGKKVLFDCDMGKKSVDIDPFGNVYPCMVYIKRHRFGNIKNQSLTEMLRRSGKIFGEIRNHACKPCVMSCCPWKSNFTIDGEKYD